METWIKLVPDREEHKTNQAEDGWAWEHPNLDKKFKSAMEAQVWAQMNVINKSWWKSLQGPNKTNRDLKVIFKEDLRHDEVVGCYYGGGVIALLPEDARVFVMTHELAHMAGWDMHDANFRRVHMKIIENIFGLRVYKSLESWYNVYIK